MGLETFLFQKKAWSRRNYCLLCKKSFIEYSWPLTASKSRHDYLMMTRYFVPCYFQLMFSETLFRETDQTVCYMLLNAPWKSFYINLPFIRLFCDILKAHLQSCCHFERSWIGLEGEGEGLHRLAVASWSCRRWLQAIVIFWSWICSMCGGVRRCNILWRGGLEPWETFLFSTGVFYLRG